jgi:hypothetical protein
VPRPACLAVGAAVVLAGAVAAGASARPAGQVATIRPNQSFALHGSHVLCIYQKRSTGAGMECGIVDSSGQPLHGSLIAVLPLTGGISVVAAYSNKVVFVRRADTMQRNAGDSSIGVGLGAQINLSDTTKMGCSTVKVSGKPTVFCDMLDGKGGFAHNSYAFGISDSTLTALYWNAKGKVSAVDSWTENG